MALPQSKTVASVNLWLAIARRWIPGLAKHQALDGLIDLTAEAFQIESPGTRHMPLAERIEAFARFSHSCAREYMNADKDPGPVMRELYRRAKLLSGEVRRVFNPSSKREYLELLRILYGIIGITVETEECGRIRVTSCAFSSVYSPHTCRIMSAVDDGIAAGLWGGGRLTFARRITEGFPCCEARFDFGVKE